MAKVVFTIQYEIFSDKKEEYLSLAKELKRLMNAEGLESYSIYQVKGKENAFEEIYVFKDYNSYENFDDIQSDRIDALTNQLSDLIKENSAKYTTLLEIEE